MSEKPYQLPETTAKRSVALLALGICFGIGGVLAFTYLFSQGPAEPRQGATCTIQVRSANFRVSSRRLDAPTDAVYGAYQSMDDDWIVIAPFESDGNLLWIPRGEVIGIAWQAENESSATP